MFKVFHSVLQFAIQYQNNLTVITAVRSMTQTAAFYRTVNLITFECIREVDNVFSIFNL